MTALQAAFIFLFLSASTLAGAAAGGAFSTGSSTETEQQDEPQTKTRKKWVFEKRPPILPPGFNPDSLTEPKTIAELTGVDYAVASIGYNHRDKLLYPAKNEWFKENEKRLKNSAARNEETDELKQIRQSFQNVEESSLDGSKLKAWCEKSYIEYHNENPELGSDVWHTCAKTS